MTKVLAYPRVSGASQIDGEGFPRQRAAIEAFCKTRGFEVERFFEEDISGTTEFEDRTQWMRLLKFSEETGIKVVIIEAAQRIARDILVSELLLRDAAKRKIEIWDASTGEEICLAPSSNPSRAFIRQIFSAVNQLDRALLTARLYDGKKRTGNWGGPGKSFTKESPAVKLILELHGTGHSRTEIAAVLNQGQQFFRPNKKPWSRQTIHNILKEAGLTRPAKQRMTVKRQVL